MPRDTPYSGVASIFASALARVDAARDFEDGGQLRDFVHVRDVAQPVVTGDFKFGDVRHVFASAQRAAEQLSFQAREDFAAGTAVFARAPLRSPR